VRLDLIGTYATHSWGAVVATFGVVAARCICSGPTNGYFHGKAEGANAEIADATTTSSGCCARRRLIVVLGVFPKPVLDRITPSVQQLIHHVAPSGVNK